jgi:hypothetical protein
MYVCVRSLTCSILWLLQWQPMAILTSGDFINMWIQGNLLTWTKRNKRKTVIWGGPFKTAATLSLGIEVRDISYFLKTAVKAGHQRCSGLVRTASSIPDWCVIIASLCVPANKSHASRSVFMTLPTAWKYVICIVSMSYLYCMLVSMSVCECFKHGVGM